MSRALGSGNVEKVLAENRIRNLCARGERSNHCARGAPSSMKRLQPKFAKTARLTHVEANEGVAANATEYRH